MPFPEPLESEQNRITPELSPIRVGILNSWHRLFQMTKPAATSLLTLALVGCRAVNILG